MKHSHFVLAGVALIATLALGAGHAWADWDNSDDTSQDSWRVEQEFILSPDFRRRVAIGLKITPVPLNFRGRSVALVGLGSYIVNAQGGCSDCHTNPSYAQGGNPFMGQPKHVNVAGYLAGGQPFGPGIVSRNLTPENGLPAGRTFAQFKQIMRTGIDLDKAHPQYGPLLQVMPWPSYQGMTDFDLRAIYTYLAAIPPIPPTE